MTNIKYLYSLIIILFLFTNLHSQSTSNFRIPLNNGNWAIKTKPEIRGTKFLTKKWSTGNIIFNDSILSQKMPLLFNLEDNNLLTTKDTKNNDAAIKLDYKGLDGFIINHKNNNLVFIKIEGNEFNINKNQTLYYQRISKSYHNNVIKKITKYVYDFGSSNGITKSGKEYRISEEYYVKKNKYYKLNSLNKKSLYKLFGNKKMIKKYIKENKISLNDSNDLDKLITFCNSIGK